MTGPESNYSNFSELRADADGILNKVRLTGMYALILIPYAGREYIENAIAVSKNIDPAEYGSGKETRHRQMINTLGNWATKSNIVN